MKKDYYIHCISFGGARFDSDPIDEENLDKELETYEALLKYFGGGIRTVYAVTPLVDNCSVYSEKIYG